MSAVIGLDLSCLEATPETGVERYARRYRQLEPNPERVVLRVTVDKVMASTYMAS